MITITSPITGATVTMDEDKARAGLERARKEIAHYERAVAEERNDKIRATYAAKLAAFRATEQSFAAALGA